MRGALVLSLLASVGTQPVLAETNPGRCSGESTQFAVDAADLSDELLPYAHCLAQAEQRYGFNSGPFAVSQCVNVRTSTAAALPDADADHGERLMDELEHGFVWAAWCSTDVGSELPANVPTKAGWPQERRTTNAPNR